MPGQWTSSCPGENHCPWNEAHASIKLSIDEIPDPAQENRHAGRHDDVVRDMIETDPVASAEQPHGQDEPQCGAVEREAPFPKSEDVFWMPEIHPGVVDDDIGEARADKHRDHEIRDENSAEPRIAGKEPLTISADDHEIADCVSEEIHEPVPGQPKRTQRENNRIKVVNPVMQVSPAREIILACRRLSHDIWPFW